MLDPHTSTDLAADLRLAQLAAQRHPEANIATVPDRHGPYLPLRVGYRSEAARGGGGDDPAR
jgi:hypothetical protein